MPGHVPLGRSVWEELSPVQLAIGLHGVQNDRHLIHVAAAVSYLA